MAGLYAFIGGAAGKFSDIMQEQRNLAGQKEIETMSLQKQKHLNEELDDEFFGDFHIQYGSDLTNAPNDPAKRRVLFNNAVRAFDNPDNIKALQSMSAYDLDNLQSYLVAKANDFFHYRPDGEGNNVIQAYDYSNLENVLGNRFFEGIRGVDPTWELDKKIDDKTGETLNINKDIVTEHPEDFDWENIPNFEETYGDNFGHEVLTKIKSSQQLSCTPIVVFTTSASKKEIRSAMLLGANSFVNKPMEADQYPLIITQILNYWRMTQSSSSMD